MLKVVIIDDEPIIVEGLSRSLDWGHWGCEVVATALSGEEGMEVIREHNPDLLFSDICMPGINGLVMLAGLKSEHPDMEISILTGYRDFEYAREAIRLGVTRFLLKPSKMDELREAVETMVGNLERKGITAKGRDAISKIVTKDNSELEENLITNKHNQQMEAINGTSHIVPMTGSRVMSVDPYHRKETADIQGELSDEKNSQESVENEAGSFIVNNAVAYMEKNYNKKLRLEEVAEQVYVSQWHLSKLLNRYKCQSFSELLNNVRIDKAKELLKDPALRIGDIAEMVGFLDMAHFSRVFKKQTGMTANEYRNMM